MFFKLTQRLRKINEILKENPNPKLGLLRKEIVKANSQYNLSEELIDELCKKIDKELTNISK